MRIQSMSKSALLMLQLQWLLLLLLLLLLVFPDSVRSFRANANGGGIDRGGTLQDIETKSPSSLPTSTALSSSSNSNSDKNSVTMLSMNNLSVGFLGCGTIASSIARGLHKACQEQDEVKIRNMVVSERSESKSRALVDDLRASFTTIEVSRTNENQKILDNCDLIFLTVLPQQASQVLNELVFDPKRHVLVSLVSTANLQDLVQDSKLDNSKVAKMICLPSIANHEGVALLCCGQHEQQQHEQQDGETKTFLTDLFGATGGVVCLDTEADLEACMVTTCTMGPLYGTMKNQRDWLLRKTESLSKQDATTLVVKQFEGAVLDATKHCHKDRLEDLIQEQTPGGLNEQALKNYGQVLDGFAGLQEPVMDAILSRIRGETNGTIDDTTE